MSDDTGVQAVIKTISSCAFCLFLVLDLLGCGDGKSEGREAASASYKIPVEMQPEPGRADDTRKYVLVDDTDFSFVFSGERLREEIESYNPDVLGLGSPADMMVIVQKYDADAEEWNASSEQLQYQRDLWTGTGHWSSACLSDEREPYTGLFKYYKVCNPLPNIHGGYFLLNRAPDPTVDAPEPRSYIVGSCREERPLEDETRAYMSHCNFRVITDSREHISFGLSGENLRLLSEVEDLIAKKLAHWRIS